MNTLKKKRLLRGRWQISILAFLSPIINGIGFAFKEVKAGEEKDLR